MLRIHRFAKVTLQITMRGLFPFNSLLRTLLTGTDGAIILLMMLIVPVHIIRILLIRWSPIIGWALAHSTYTVGGIEMRGQIVYRLTTSDATSILMRQLLLLSCGSIHPTYIIFAIFATFINTWILVSKLWFFSTVRTVCCPTIARLSLLISLKGWHLLKIEEHSWLNIAFVLKQGIIPLLEHCGQLAIPPQVYFCAENHLFIGDFVIHWGGAHRNAMTGRLCKCSEPCSAKISESFTTEGRINAEFINRLTVIARIHVYWVLSLLLLLSDSLS